MDEENWLTCNEPQQILEFLRDKASDRQWRLFAVAAICHVPVLVEDDWDQTAVDVAERYADGRASDRELEEACRAEPTDLGSAKDVVAFYHAYSCAVNACPLAVGRVLHLPDFTNTYDRPAEWSYQANLLRHIFGNPFKPYPAPATWPSTVVQLAASLYDGHDCRLPLSDALEESGHQELAEHFRKEEWHPKGCFAMDLILSKG